MSKAVRRQREQLEQHEADAKVRASSSAPRAFIPVDAQLVSAVKNQMVPAQHRSDMVDVRNNILGLRECHIVAALLGLPADQYLVRKIQLPQGQQEQSAPKKKKRQAGDADRQLPADAVLEPIPAFFDRVLSMRLQLGASVVNGLGAVLTATRLLHVATLRRLDLSRNKLTPADAPLLVSVIEQCPNLGILCLSHNVLLKSKGVVPVCAAAGRLPQLRALLLEKCSVDSSGAIEIAQLLAAKQLPVPLSVDERQRQALQQQPSSQHRQAQPTVLLTIDLSHNRIGADGIVALRRALPWYVGLGVERQSPPVRKVDADADADDRDKAE